MPITPEDIQLKEFPVRLRGFDTEAVDTFLEEVAEDLFHLMQENTRLRDRFTIQEKRIRELEDLVKTGETPVPPKKVEEPDPHQVRLSQTEEKLIALRNRVRDELRETLNWYVGQLTPPVVPEKTVPLQKPLKQEEPEKREKPAQQKEAHQPERHERFREPDPAPDPEESLYEIIDLPETPAAPEVPIKRLVQESVTKAPQPAPPVNPVKETPPRDSLFGMDIDIDHGPEPAITLGSDDD